MDGFSIPESSVVLGLDLVLIEPLGELIKRVTLRSEFDQTANDGEFPLVGDSVTIDDTFAVTRLGLLVMGQSFVTDRDVEFVEVL